MGCTFWSGSPPLPSCCWDKLWHRSCGPPRSYLPKKQKHSLASPTAQLAHIWQCKTTQGVALIQTTTFHKDPHSEKSKYVNYISVRDLQQQWMGAILAHAHLMISGSWICKLLTRYSLIFNACSVSYCRTPAPRPWKEELRLTFSPARGWSRWYSITCGSRFVSRLSGVKIIVWSPNSGWIRE